MLAFWTRGFPCQGTGKENLWCPEYSVVLECYIVSRHGVSFLVDYTIIEWDIITPLTLELILDEHCEIK